MKKVFIILCVILLSISAYAEILVEFTNPITIQSLDGNSVTPAIGLDIGLGSKVTIEQNGKATLMDDMGTFTVLNSGETLTTGQPIKNEPVDGKSTIKALAVAVRDATSSSEGPTVYGMVKRGTSLAPIVRPINPPPYHAIYPVSVAIEKPRPIIFKWNVDENRNGIYIILEDNKKTRLLTKAVNFDSGKSQIGPMPFVQGERYSWWLAKKDQDKFVSLTNKYSFYFLKTERLNQLNADIKTVEKAVSSEKSRNLLLGQLYYSYGLYNRAIEYLVPIYKEQPTDFLKFILLKSFYSQRLPHEADELGLTQTNSEEVNKEPIPEKPKTMKFKKRGNK